MKDMDHTEMETDDPVMRAMMAKCRSEQTEAETGYIDESFSEESIVTNGSGNSDNVKEIEPETGFANESIAPEWRGDTQETREIESDMDFPEESIAPEWPRKSKDTDEMEPETGFLI